MYKCEFLYIIYNIYIYEFLYIIYNIAKKPHETAGTKHLALVQIQLVKCVSFWFPYVESILFGSTI